MHLNPLSSFWGPVHTSHVPDKGQVAVRYYGLCKALHKPYYAEFKIMLSYKRICLIFRQLRSMMLSIILQALQER